MRHQLLALALAVMACTPAFADQRPVVSAEAAFQQTQLPDDSFTNQLTQARVEAAAEQTWADPSVLQGAYDPSQSPSQQTGYAGTVPNHYHQDKTSYVIGSIVYGLGRLADAYTTRRVVDNPQEFPGAGEANVVAAHTFVFPNVPTAGIPRQITQHADLITWLFEGGAAVWTPIHLHKLYGYPDHLMWGMSVISVGVPAWNWHLISTF